MFLLSCNRNLICQTLKIQNDPAVLTWLAIADFGKCMLTSVRNVEKENEKAHNVYHRCLCLFLIKLDGPRTTRTRDARAVQMLLIALRQIMPVLPFSEITFSIELR